MVTPDKIQMYRNNTKKLVAYTHVQRTCVRCNKRRSVAQFLGVSMVCEQCIRRGK